MNAIEAMRSRARQAGKLKTSPHLRVDRPRAAVARWDQLAMRNERPRGAQPMPIQHLAERHAENNHHHDKHDGQERHG